MIIILGHDGKRGKDGKNAEYSKIEKKKENFFVNVYMYCHFKYGDIGGRGGAGDRGGNGGFKGYGGQSYIILESTLIEVKKCEPRVTYNGRTGSAGMDGFTGLYGLTANLCELDDFPDYKYLSFSLKNNLKNNIATYKNKELNFKGQVNAEQSKIFFYEKETEYFKYLSEIRSKYKYSRFMHQDFCISVIEETHFKPEISNLIERLKLLNEYEYRHLLPALKNEMIDFFQNKNTSIQEKTVLKYTLAQVSSTICRHNSAEKTVLVGDVNRFLEISVEHINNWKSLAQQSVRDVYKNNYVYNIKKKIEDAKDLLNRLEIEIEKNDEQMNKDIGGDLNK